MGVDEETFLQHLDSLNIDSNGVSFGWLLEENNPILNWFYENVDINNCLSPSEKSYFTDLKEHDNMLEGSALKKELDDICSTYDGIVTPKDGYGIEDARQRVHDQEEWIQLMDEQEIKRKKCTERNEEIGRQLSKEKFDLTEALSIESAMVSRLMEECEELVVKARDEELKSYNLMEDILKICTGSRNAEDKLFFSQMPLEEFYTKTELLATYVRHNIGHQLNLFNSHREATPSLLSNQLTVKDSPMQLNQDRKAAECNLTEVCEKLREAIWCYIKSKADISGMLEQIKYLENYDASVCFDSSFEKVKYSGVVKVLEKDVEQLKVQRVTQDIHKFVDGQSEKLILGEMQLRHAKTKHIYDKLCSLVNLSSKALQESEIAVMCAKRDQVTVENLHKFSLDYLNTIQSFVLSNKARQMVPRPVSSPCFLLQTLVSFLQCPISDVTSTASSSHVAMCMARMERLEADIQRLEMEVFYSKFNTVKEAIEESFHKSAPMKRLIWDGPTGQPNMCNAALDMALYDVKLANIAAEEDIKKIAKTYMEFKKIIEQESVLNNLWKWFLADQNQIRLMKSKFQSRESKPIKPFKT